MVAHQVEAPWRHQGGQFLVATWPWIEAAVIVASRGSCSHNKRSETVDICRWTISIWSTWPVGWRTTIGEEVDLVIEIGDRLLPIEIKASGRPRMGDAKHLRTFLSEYGDRARCGLLLHNGREIEWITSDVLAVPWWRVI
jgi:hypothetical protein